MAANPTTVIGLEDCSSEKGTSWRFIPALRQAQHQTCHEFGMMSYFHKWLELLVMVVSQPTSDVKGTWLLERLLWATLCADRMPCAHPGVALSNKEEGWKRENQFTWWHLLNLVTGMCRPPDNYFLFFSPYLGNFNAPILFLGLVCSSIVMPGTIVINQLPVPLGDTSLSTRKQLYALSLFDNIDSNVTK